jgi:hypothetical protein
VSPPPERLLIEAAQHYAHVVTGRNVVRIKLKLDDGSTRTIELPRGPSPWPPHCGWSLRGGCGSFNGSTFALAGKSLAVFRALVEAGADGVAFDALNQQVWDGLADTRTIENALTALRKQLREALNLEENPLRSEVKRVWLELD